MICIFSDFLRLIILGLLIRILQFLDIQDLAIGVCNYDPLDLGPRVLRVGRSQVAYIDSGLLHNFNYNHGISQANSSAPTHPSRSPFNDPKPAIQRAAQLQDRLQQQDRLHEHLQNQSHSLLLQNHPLNRRLHLRRLLRPHPHLLAHVRLELRTPETTQRGRPNQRQLLQAVLEQWVPRSCAFHR